MFLLFIFLFPETSEYSSISMHFFEKNLLDYKGAFIRESEFEVFAPFYFYLKEIQFYKSEKEEILPYQIRFEWDMGFKKSKGNFNIRTVYNHVCNHGIDHPGYDRRQWNQLAVKVNWLGEKFSFLNSAGYVVSPFGPKRKNNNYNWIFMHEFILEKEIKNFFVFFGFKLQGFLEIHSIRYSGVLRIFIGTAKIYTGYGLWREYGLRGKNNEAITLKEIFSGIIERIPYFKVSYGYLFKNPSYSFFSDFLVKYEIFRNFRFITGLKTISPPKTQQPRFYDYKTGIEFGLKKAGMSFYHRERRDGNLFDGKTEKINALNIKFLDFSIDYILSERNFPFRVCFGISTYRFIYRWEKTPFWVKFRINFYYLNGKEKGFVFEAGPSFCIKVKREIDLSFSQKIASDDTLEKYGIFEQRFFISVEK